MSIYLRSVVLIIGGSTLAACAAQTVGPSQAAVAPATCLTQVGTRLPYGDPHCSTLRQSYSSDDISRTGAVTAGTALQLLDPSITVHR